MRTGHQIHSNNDQRSSSRSQGLYDDLWHKWALHSSHQLLPRRIVLLSISCLQQLNLNAVAHVSSIGPPPLTSPDNCFVNGNENRKRQDEEHEMCFPFLTYSHLYITKNHEANSHLPREKWVDKYNSLIRQDPQETWPNSILSLDQSTLFIFIQPFPLQTRYYNSVIFQ